MRACTFVGFGSVVLALAACSNSTGTTASCANSGAAVTVRAVGTTAFSPDSVSITAGESVCWENTTGVNHTVTADDGTSFDSALPNGGTYIHVFSAAGTSAYHCTIHPVMTGKVTVTVN